MPTNLFRMPSGSSKLTQVGAAVDETGSQDKLAKEVAFLNTE
jgi:hypothetical protein